jgi:hypothetical protein
MADPTFWRDLADKFRALDPDGLLCADWKSERGLPYVWSIRAKQLIWGGRDTQVQFEALARYGGAEVENPHHSRSLIDAWLDAVNKETESDTFGSGPEDAEGKPTSTWGSIHRICQASATFCHILESRALDAEKEVPTSAKPVQPKSALSELRALGMTIDIDENAAARIWGGLQIIDGRYFQGNYHEDKKRPGPTTRQHFFDAYHTIAENIVHANTPDEVLENMIPAMIEAFRLKEDWRPRMSYDTFKRFLGGPVSEWKGKRLLMQAAETVSPPPVTIDLEELKAIRTSLDDQDALIFEGIKKNPKRSIPLSQVHTIEGLFNRIHTHAPGLIQNFTFEREPNALRSQLRAARSNVEHRITVLEPHGTGNSDEPKSNPTCAQLKRLIDESHISVEELAEAIEADTRSVYRHLSGETLPQPKSLASYERVFSERLERKVHIKKMPGKCQ